MIKLTDIAKQEVEKLIQREGRPGSFFRVGVKEGCCFELSYDAKLDDKIGENDRVYEIGGVKVVCDSDSLKYLENTAIDYSKAPEGGGFKFMNPNASGTCGCGASFSA